MGTYEIGLFSRGEEGGIAREHAVCAKSRRVMCQSVGVGERRRLWRRVAALKIGSESELFERFAGVGAGERGKQSHLAGRAFRLEVVWNVSLAG